jgi:hypothetical protein
LAFQAELAGPGVDATNNRGIWVQGRDIGWTLVARTGDPAPGAASGVNFSALGAALLNGPGEIAFLGRVSGPGVSANNDDGIWAEREGTGLTLVAREGEPAPGTQSGVQFSTLLARALNAAGQVAFSARLTGSGFSFDEGIWAQNRSGELILIARAGEQLDVDDGPGLDLRTISSLSFAGNSGNEDGRHSAFNDRGQLAFAAIFTDGTTGVFVSNRVAIPEPTSHVSFVVVMLGIATTVRRRTPSIRLLLV